MALVAAVIIGANTLPGVGAVTAAWPFACYPTFAGIAVASRAEIVLVLQRPGGADLTLDGADRRRLVGWEKLDGLARPILRGGEDSRQRAAALIEVAEDAGVEIPPGSQVDVYRTVVSLDRHGVVAGDLERLFVVER